MWSKQIIELLLTQYQQHENLYNFQHKDYFNRVKRSKSLVDICEHLKKLDANISVDDVKSKFHMLRGQYVKETYRIAESERSDADNVYVPRLWYYPLLNFLDNHTYSRSTAVKRSHDNKEIKKPIEKHKVDREGSYIDESTSNHSSTQSTRSTYQPSTQSTKSTYQPSTQSTLNKRKLATNLSGQIASSPKHSIFKRLRLTNNYEWLGKQVVFELENIKDEEIQRDTSWKVQTLLRETNVGIRNRMMSPKTSSTIPTLVQCRTCGEKIYNLNAKNLFEEENNAILDDIRKLTGIQLDDEENMPKHICACCHSDLNHSVAFRERCIKTHQLLIDTQHMEKTFDPLTTASAEADNVIPNIVSKKQMRRDVARTHTKPYHISSGQSSTQTSSKRIKKENHVRQHENQIAYPVPVRSNFAFSAPRRNKKAKDEKRTFICDQCGKHFTDSSNLKLHLLRHTGVKDFECPDCGRKYITLHLLNLHIRVRHKGEMPYACKFCEQRFYTSTSRCRHERVKHTKKLVYTCRICGKSYTTKSYLNRHEFLHTGERPHCCEICDMAFPRNTNLKIHYRSKQHQKKADELREQSQFEMIENNVEESNDEESNDEESNDEEINYEESNDEESNDEEINDEEEDIIDEDDIAYADTIIEEYDE